MGNTTKTNSVEVEDKKKKPKIRNSSGESGFYSGEAGEPDCVLPKKSRSLKKRANIANAIAARFSTNRKPSMRGSSKKKLKKKNSLKSCEVLSDYDDDCEVSMVLPPQPTEELPKSLTMADFLVSCDNINEDYEKLVSSEKPQLLDNLLGWSQTATLVQTKKNYEKPPLLGNLPAWPHSAYFESMFDSLCRTSTSQMTPLHFEPYFNVDPPNVNEANGSQRGFSNSRIHGNNPTIYKNGLLNLDLVEPCRPENPCILDRLSRQQNIVPNNFYQCYNL